MRKSPQQQQTKGFRVWVQKLMKFSQFVLLRRLGLAKGGEVSPSSKKRVNKNEYFIPQPRHGLFMVHSTHAPANSETEPTAIRKPGHVNT